MTADEFVFGLPGNPGFRKQDGTLEWDKKFPLMSLQDYDQILGDSIRTWETNVKRGFVILYQMNQNGQDNDPRPTSLGLMSVDDAKRKFR
jgi:hypothetical protein